MGEQSQHKASKAVAMETKTALIVARCIWLAANLAMCTWLLFAGTPFWQHSSSFYSNLVFMVVVPALLAVSSVGVVVLQPLFGQQHAHSGSCSRLAAHLLAPRCFWQQMLGGLTLLDLAVLCFLAQMNGIWACALLTSNWRLLLPEAALHGVATPTNVMIIKMIAESFGSLLAPNLVLLLYPITRGSVVLQALRLPYPEAIRYHRWVGHYTLLLVLLHCIMYYAAWGYEGIFIANAFAQGSEANGLFGSMAFLLSMVMWVACAQAIRRKAYEVFKALHHVGFYAFLVLGCCHYWQMIWWCLPGLVLYFLEVAMRIWQGSSSGSVRILHAFASPDQQLCSVVLSAPDYAVASSGVVWLSAPGISWFGTWHPFDYIAVPWPAGNGLSSYSKCDTAAVSNRDVTAMLINMKAFDGWTRKFIAHVAQQGVNISVKMQGPYAGVGGSVIGHQGEQLSTQAAASTATQHATRNPSGAIIVAGGISITPAMVVLQELAAAQEGSRLPVLLIWSFRHAAELELLCPPLLAMAGALRLQLTTQLFYTGCLSNIQLPRSGFMPHQLQLTAGSSPVAGQHSNDSAANAVTVLEESLQLDLAVLHVMTDPEVSNSNRSSSSDDEDSKNDSSITSKSPAAAAAVATAPAAGSKPGLAVSPLCPVVSLDSYCSQACFKLLLHVAAYAGALCAVIVGHYIIVGRRPEPLPTNQAGALMNALVAAAVLLPATAVLAAGLLIKSRSKAEFLGGGTDRSGVKLSGENAAEQNVAAEGSAGGASGTAATLAAAAAAAADTVRHGSCGRLINSSSGNSGLQLELPALQGGTAVAGSSGVLQVTAGRPQLQPLVEGWLAMLRRLPKAVESCGGSSEQQRKSERQLICSLYAMGPAPLVADAQVLCGGLKAVLFVQKTYQL